MAAKPGAQSGGDRCGDTVAKALQIQPSERDLREIANGCGANWKSLLTFVGLKLTEIQECEDKEKYLPDACFRGLVFWLNENADLAVSWNTLLKAMEMARMKSDARKWRDSIEGRAASLDKPGDAEQSGTLNDETPTPAQEEPRSNVPKLATTKACLMEEVEKEKELITEKKPILECSELNEEKVLRAFPSHSGPKQTKTLGDDPHIKKFKLNLMDGYKNLTPSESPVRVEYVQLFLLKVQQHKRNEDEKARLKKGDHHGNKVDLLKKIKSGGSKSGKDEDFIDVSDLLKPTSDLDNRMKVVYGQAGIGKTTMLTHICRSLALDKPIQSSYALVLYFPLWDKVVSSAKCLKGLLSYYATADLDLDLSALRRAIVNSGSKEVLFIFDGADEVQDLLSSEERGVFQELLEGRTLPQADVIVSSRPGGLSHVIKLNVPIIYEIHGLPKLSIQNYIKEFFKSSPEKGERLWKELQSRDDLMGGAHIPMNLLIFCHIFAKGGLPPTLTDCYKQYIVEVHNRESPEKKWRCFDRCPEDVKQLLHSLGRLAYNGLMSTPSTFVFKEQEVEEAFKTTSLDKSTFNGLLHEHPSISEVYSSNSTFNFSHTTQQELFSAYYISHLPVEEQIKFLRGNCSKPKFSMVLRFYAGLTGLVDENVVHTVLHESFFFNQHPFLRKVSTTDQSICALDELMCDNVDPGLLHLFHFLYESQNSVLTQSVARHLNGKSIKFSLFLTSYDTRVIAHCLRESHSFSQLGFGRFTTDEDSDLLMLSCLSSILMSDLVHIQRLTLGLNRLTQTGGFLLKEGLSRSAVEDLDLKMQHADMPGIAAIFEATRLKRLKLNVMYKFDADSRDLDPEVAQSAARNTRIKELEIDKLPALLLFPVVKGLAANTFVEKLVLRSLLLLSSHGGRVVGQALATACATNTTLKDIDLGDVSPFPLMEVLCSREVPLDRLALAWYPAEVIDSDLDVAQSSARNTKIKALKIGPLRLPFLLPVVKGLAANTFVEKLALHWPNGNDDGGQTMATVCTTNTTLKDIELINVSPFPLMEVLCSREVPLERLAITWHPDSVSDSDLEVAQSTVRNTRIKELEITLHCEKCVLPALLLLSVVKGLAANTFVEKLVLRRYGDEGGLGQALATACTTNTTLKDIELCGVFPVPLMEVLCSREVPLERLAITTIPRSKDPSPYTPETLETLVQNMKVKRFKLEEDSGNRLLILSTEYHKALADALSRNKSLKEVELVPSRLPKGCIPADVKDYYSAKLSTLETVKIHFPPALIYSVYGGPGMVYL